MTHDEIRAAISASPVLTQLVRTDSQAVADALSVGRVKLVERMISIGTVLKYLGPANGAALLDQMEAMRATNPTIKWGWYLLERGELDVSLESTREMLDALLPPAASAALKGLAEAPDPVDELEVRRACLNDDGSWRV